MLDDVLDVSGPAERTGKHRGTDLLDGTVTLPLILARERDPALRSLDLREVRTPAQAEAVCDAIVATGVLGRRARERAGDRGGGEGRPPGAARGPAGRAGAGGRRRRRPVQPRSLRGGSRPALSARTNRSISSSMFACCRRLRSRDQDLGADVELLVEAVDGGLVERVDLAPLAVRAAQEDLPVRRGGLLPLDRVHEIAVAARGTRGGRGRGRTRDADGGLVGQRLEVHDLDRTTRGQHHAADVLAVVGVRCSS